MSQQNVPAAILMFLHKEIDNEYSPQTTLRDAKERIAEYSKNNDIDRLLVFINHDLPGNQKEELWAYVREYGVSMVYSITPSVLYAAHI